MEKIRNFSTVDFNSAKNSVVYSYFIKNEDGTWTKKNSQKYIENDVYIPNIKAVGRLRSGQTQNIHKDLFGNPILSCVLTKFFDKNPPETIKNAPIKFGSDIHPTTKFLAENFDFDPEVDEIPPFRIQYMDIETLVDDGGFLQAWNVGPDRQGHTRGGITLISSYDNIDDLTTIFGVNPYTSLEPLPEKTKYVWCKDERGVIREYMKYLKTTDPDILTHWNGYDYDIPYIINRMVQLFGPKSLSHFGNGSAWIDNNKRRFTLRGINSIDYMVIYKKFELKPRRSYSLDSIITAENILIDGKGKIKYEGSIRDFYENNWNEFVKYCVQDAKLVYELDNKKKLIETFVMCCYMAGISLSQAIAQDVSWMRIHDAAIYRYCKDLGKELPDGKSGFEEVDQFAGAYVMDPVPGVYDYVTVFDVNSLYPSCIRALNISIETYRGQVKSGNITTQQGPFVVEFYDSLYLSLGVWEKNILELYNKHTSGGVDVNIGNPKTLSFGTFSDLQIYLQNLNYCVAANGAIFTKEFRGVIPSLLDNWIAIRKKNKNLYFEYKQKYQETGDLKCKALSDRYNTIQNVLKVRLNSLYGFVGTRFSRFYHTNLAEAVTATGQYVIKSTISYLNSKNVLYNPFYCDTDSVFIHYGKVLKYLGYKTTDENKIQCVEKCLEIDKEISSYIKDCMENICSNVMMTPNMYNFESEEVISKMLITSKKKYIAQLAYDKTTGQYPESEFTIKGMEFKKSNLSDPIKNILQDLTVKIMNGKSADDITNILRDTFMELPSRPIDDIAYAQGVRNIEEFASSAHIKIYDNKTAEVRFPNKCPYHVSGALVMNALIDADPRLSDMNKIREGQKGKIIFVTPVNMFGVKAITLSPDTSWSPILYEYFTIDIEYMFNRLILGPLQPTFDAMKYKINLDGILGYKFLDSSNKYVQSLLF